jgi:AcrR family transcriptional regulator
MEEIDETVIGEGKALAAANGANTGSAPGAVPRTPQQARGKARVELILDAAAALVAETGLASVTMHKVAKRAKTPIGSMYHFFPDRDSLVLALRDRHQSAMDAIYLTLHQTSDAQWRSFATAEVIDGLVAPYIAYLEQNPDCLLIFKSRPDDEKDHDRGVQFLRAVLDIRVPQAKPAERQLYAEMLNALAVGSLNIRLDAAGEDRLQASRYLREMRRALILYLADIEAVHAR